MQGKLFSIKKPSIYKTSEIYEKKKRIFSQQDERGKGDEAMTVQDPIKWGVPCAMGKKNFFLFHYLLYFLICKLMHKVMRWKCRVWDGCGAWQRINRPGLPTKLLLFSLELSRIQQTPRGRLILELCKKLEIMPFPWNMQRDLNLISRQYCSFKDFYDIKGKIICEGRDNREPFVYINTGYRKIHGSSCYFKRYQSQRKFYINSAVITN